jgi:phosphate uptake regulator
MAGHRQDFDPELEAIEAKIIELFAMVAEDLPSATRALVTGNNKLLKVLAAPQQVVDALYAEIEKPASREILLQARVASELWLLLSVLRIEPDLERAYHSVVEIAARANHILGEDLSPHSQGLVERAGPRPAGISRRGGWTNDGNGLIQRNGGSISTSTTPPGLSGAKPGR